MKRRNLIQRIKNNLEPAQKLPDDVVIKFLKVLENIPHEEMSCEETYAQLDEFVEREVKSHDAARIMPLIREHIDLCPECCDEYEALLDVLEHTKEN